MNKHFGVIRYLTHNEIDRYKWDACVENSCFETIYPYSWYLDLVSPEWEALMEDDYTTVFPLTWKKKFGISYLIQPTLTQQLGLFSSEKPERLRVLRFLNKIPAHFKHLDICLNGSNELDDKRFIIIPRVNYELALDRSYDDLYKAYSTNNKRNLKKAINNQLILRNVDVADFISLKIDPAKKSQEMTDHYQRLVKIFTGIVTRKKGEIKGIYFNDRLCAAVVWTFSKSRIIYMNAVSDKSGRENRAMFLLVDDLIRRNAGKNLILDFEGSTIPGIARFFEGFGAEKKEYLRIRKSVFPLTLKKDSNK